MNGQINNELCLSSVEDRHKRGLYMRS